MEVPLNLPDTLFSTFLLFPLFFIENECLYAMIWDFKREKKKFGQQWIQTRIDRIKSTRFTNYTTALDIYEASFVELTAPITRWGAELVLIASDNKLGYFHLVHSEKENMLIRNNITECNFNSINGYACWYQKLTIHYVCTVLFCLLIKHCNVFWK